MNQKRIKSLICALCVLIITTTQAQSNFTTRYGGEAELSAIGGGRIVYYGSVNYKYTLDQNFKAANSIVGGTAGLGVAIMDDFQVLLEGGYEYNVTMERGQPVAGLRVNTPVIVANARLHFPQIDGYKMNGEGSLVFHPSQGNFGIGGFVSFEYDCMVLGPKVALRFGRTKNSRGSNNCWSCGF